MNALLEVDELERAYPPLPDERVFAHVSARCCSYREADHRLLLITVTIEGAGYGDGLLAAVGADEWLVVALTASPTTLERRIRAREPATWSGLEDLVMSAAALAREVPRAIRSNLILDTDALDLCACRMRVCAALGAHDHDTTRDGRRRRGQTEPC